MLVLSRKESQKIIIDDNIVVTILDIKRDHVRLGFEAPRTISVHREEVAQRIAGTPRDPACPASACVSRYARSVVGLAEVGVDSGGLREHLKGCGSCRHDLRRAIPV